MNRAMSEIRQLYQTGLNRENLLVRLIFIVIFTIPAGILIFFTGGYLAYAISYILKQIGIYEAMSEFSGFFIDATCLFLVYIFIYAIFRFVVKLKTHYIDMALMLVIISAAMSPSLKGYSGWPPIPDFSFAFAITFLFGTIIFALFAALTALLDKLTAMKDWQKFIIALAASLSLGLLVSWLVWISIARNYLS